MDSDGSRNNDDPGNATTGIGSDETPGAATARTAWGDVPISIGRASQPLFGRGPLTIDPNATVPLLNSLPMLPLVADQARRGIERLFNPAVTVLVKRLHDKGRLPSRTHIGDAAFDLYAAASTVLVSGEAPTSIGTGIALAIPAGWCGIIKERSGLGTRGVAVRGGVIDSGYRGEIKVMLQLQNEDLDHSHRMILVGDRIAQLLIVRVPETQLIEVEDLPEGNDSRGAAGFGSSGK